MKSKHVLLFLFAAFVCTRAAAQQVIPATSFGNNGIFQQTVSQDKAYAGFPIIQPDGKLLVSVTTGDTKSTNQFIYRITRTGEIDTGFANNGILQVGLLDRKHHSDMKSSYFDLQPDGKIVVATTLLDPASYINRIAIERYMPDGKPDSSFGINGESSLPGHLFGSLSTTTASNLKIKPDGKILVTANVSGPSITNSIIAQYKTNGYIDRSFGDSGVFQTTSPYEQYIGTLLVLPNNYFVTTGNFTNDGINFSSCETIHKGDGSIDSTKGNNGVIINGYTLEQTWSGVALQNKKLLVYATIQIGDSLVSVVFRYNADGTLDNSFGNNGMATAFTNPFEYYPYPPRAIKVQDNGKIIIDNNIQTQLLRLNRDGSRDYSFGTNGILSDAFLYSNNMPFALNHNRLYITGIKHEKDENFPLIAVKAYDFCYTCATAENNNGLITQLKTTDALADNTALHFYPNPVKDKLIITGLPAGTNTYLQLTDANGRVVQRATTQSATFQWKVQLLPPGVYYLTIIKDKSLPVTYKVIKD